MQNANPNQTFCFINFNSKWFCIDSVRISCQYLATIIALFLYNTYPKWFADISH